MAGWPGDLLEDLQAGSPARSMTYCLAGMMARWLAGGILDIWLDYMLDGFLPGIMAG
mgnify:CR=1 FL=1